MIESVNLDAFSVSEELPAVFWDSLAFRLAVFSSVSLQIGRVLK